VLKWSKFQICRKTCTELPCTDDPNPCTQPVASLHSLGLHYSMSDFEFQFLIHFIQLVLLLQLWLSCLLYIWLVYNSVKSSAWCYQHVSFAIDCGVELCSEFKHVHIIETEIRSAVTFSGISLPPPGGIMITQVCLFVCWFVALVAISRPAGLQVRFSWNLTPMFSVRARCHFRLSTFLRHVHHFQQ